MLKVIPDSSVYLEPWLLLILQLTLAYLYFFQLVLTMFSLICSDVEARTLELENQVRQLKQLFKPW